MRGVHIYFPWKRRRRSLGSSTQGDGNGQTVNGEVSLLHLLFPSQAFPPWLKCQLPVHVSEAGLL